MKFSDYEFGYDSAEEERRVNSRLLTDKLYKAPEIRSVIEGDQHAVILGRKGTGKTAALEHFTLMNDGHPEKFITKQEFKNFSHIGLGKVVRGTSEPEVKYPDAWLWMLCIMAIESFSRDASAISDIPSELPELVNSLKVAGLLKNPTPQGIVSASSKRSFKFKLPGFFELNENYEQPDGPADVVTFAQNLRAFLQKLSSNSRHYILIDGLDDVLASRSVQQKTLSSFFHTLIELNDDLLSNNVPIKFVVFCRTELFEELSSPNLNKVKRRRVYELDWYKNPRDPLSSELMNLVRFRSRSDVVHKHFDSTIDGQKSIYWLMALTRFTPRDFLQLLSCIQSISSQFSGALPDHVIKGGAGVYSKDYLYPEILDELSGFTGQLTPAQVLRSIATFGARSIRVKELREELLNAGLEDSQFDRILYRLYDSGAVGAVNENELGDNRFSFRYRNKPIEIKSYHAISIHKGLWKVMNLT